MLTAFKVAFESCFLKTTTPKFRKCKEKYFKILAKSLESICEGTPLNGCFLTFAGLQISRKVIG